VTISAAPTPSTVTFIRFVLRMLEPGAVTVPRPADQGEVDAVPDVDCHGRAHLPGTSLAGALRAWTRAAHDNDDVVADRWFGHLIDPAPGSGGTGVDAVASEVWVLGSELVDDAGRPRDDDTGLRLDRWSTAIDRTRGAARANSLRGITVLAPGTRFEVFLRWDDAPDDDRDRLLHLLAGWRPVIGRGTSRGMGRCTVEDLRHGALDLADPGDLLTWLTRSGPDLVRAVAVHRPSPLAAIEATVLSDPFGTVIEIPVQVAGPLHIGGGSCQVQEDADGHQIQTPLREGGRLVVPGAGLKGLLRARIEFILCSVGLTGQACLSSRDGGVPCGRCWTCQVFGYGGAADSTSTSVGARAGVRVCDAPIANAVTRRRTHVAIDRFTGGAADDLLYTFEVVESGRFTLRIEVQRSWADDPLLGALLRLALADLDDGLIGIGRAVTRGYGWVSLDLQAAEHDGLLPDLSTAQAELAAALAAASARNDSDASSPDTAGGRVEEVLT
jgi:CRISPR/Cas system CSM-associated protein Csm3 (group 7 of RAMP superfamily)